MLAVHRLERTIRDAIKIEGHKILRKGTEYAIRYNSYRGCSDCSWIGDVFWKKKAESIETENKVLIVGTNSDSKYHR